MTATAAGAGGQALGAPAYPLCEWSTVCPRWPSYAMERVQYRNAPVEQVTVCDEHLVHARAKGYRVTARR